MKSRIFLLVLTTMAICSSVASEDAPKTEPELITLKKYTEDLIKTYGENAIIFSGEVDGFMDKDGTKSLFTDTWPLAPGVDDDNRAAEQLAGGYWSPTLIPCTHPYAPYKHVDGYACGNKWCAWCLGPMTANHEAKKETWRTILGLPWFRTNIADYDCQKATDRMEIAKSPTTYVLAGCP